LGDGKAIPPVNSPFLSFSFAKCMEMNVEECDGKGWKSVTGRGDFREPLKP